MEQARAGFFTKIAGVSHENSDGTFRQSIIKRCRPGEILRLVREPNNAHDANAVKVLRRNGEQLGYLPGHVVMTGLARDIDRGTQFRVEIKDITGGGRQTLGVNIRITELDEPHASEGTPSLYVNALVYVLAIVAVIIITVLIYERITS